MLFAEEHNSNLLSGFPGELYYHPSAIAANRAEELFLLFIANIAWKSETIFIYGKERLQPRLTAWYGDASAVYTYSGRANHPLPFTPELLELKAIAEKYTDSSFNSVLLNYYRNGDDSMGFHRDNEKELGTSPCIASISLGAERDFVVRPYKHLQPRYSFKLGSGSLLIMKGDMQRYWEHALPKRSNVPQARINLTFRKVV